jgi:ferritin-like protein
MAYIESWEELSKEAKDIHRALESLREEIEAIDWYQQRVDLTGDDELRAVLAHNRDEEIEHAAMVLEWLRRNMDGWNHELKEYLFTTDPIAEAEAEGHEER